MVDYIVQNSSAYRTPYITYSLQNCLTSNQEIARAWITSFPGSQHYRSFKHDAKTCRRSQAVRYIDEPHHNHA